MVNIDFLTLQKPPDLLIRIKFYQGLYMSHR